MAGTYLYGVVDVNGKGRGSWGAIGIGSPRREVYVVAEGDIGAVVSESPPPPLLPLREHVSAHQSVLERAMQRHTVLPFSFGTVADDDQLVRQFLAAHEGAESSHQAELTIGAEHFAGTLEQLRRQKGRQIL